MFQRVQRYQNNGFEQFCVNLANEKLQQFFLQTVFKKEQILYAKEKLQWKENVGTAADNQYIIDLMAKRPDGIAAILEDECKFPKVCILFKCVTSLI